MPIYLTDDEIFVFSNNYFYKNWNNVAKEKQIEFILPLENIEIIQYINRSRNNLLNLELNDLFKEYPNKNFALVLIDNSDISKRKIYFKTNIQGKTISKNINLDTKNFDEIKLNEFIILKTKE